MKRRTIANSFKLDGVGLHTGRNSKMTFFPADDGHGIRFVHHETKEELIAHVRNVVNTQRSTSLANGDFKVETIEHLLSAINAMGIDDILIEIDGEEVPIFDGSAKVFVKALKEAGQKEHETDREYLEISEYAEFKHGEAEYILMPYDGIDYQVLVDYSNTPIRKQFAHLAKIDDYTEEFADSRTFGFFSEIHHLLERGLIRGGDLSNALILVDVAMDEKEIKSIASKFEMGDATDIEGGILNASKMKYYNEPARHKLVDLIGDLTLIGKPIKGKIIAKKPGHTANVELTKWLKSMAIKQKKLRGIPKVDMKTAALMDINQISDLLPHRFPFLLVDKIVEISDNHVVGIKNVTINEHFFEGHFPNNPILPGVLQIEAMAQVGGILALTLQDDPKGWDTYFLKIDKVKFKQKIIPGDVMIIKLILLQPIRRGIVHMSGTIYVGENIVSEGELTAQIVKR